MIGKCKGYLGLLVMALATMVAALSLPNPNPPSTPNSTNISSEASLNDSEIAFEEPFFRKISYDPSASLETLPSGDDVLKLRFMLQMQSATSKNNVFDKEAETALSDWQQEHMLPEAIGEDLGRLSRNTSLALVTKIRDTFQWDGSTLPASTTPWKYVIEVITPPTRDPDSTFCRIFLEDSLSSGSQQEFEAAHSADAPTINFSEDTAEGDFRQWISPTAQPVMVFNCSTHAQMSNNGLARSQLASNGATPTGAMIVDLNSKMIDEQSFGKWPVNRVVDGVGGWAAFSSQAADPIRSGILVHTGEWNVAPPQEIPPSHGCVHVWPETCAEIAKRLSDAGVVIEPNTNGKLPYPYTPQGVMFVHHGEFSSSH